MREDVWLGQHLGRPAWTVEGEDAPAAIAARDPGFFRAKVPTDQVSRVGELEDAGFRMIDVNVTLSREPGPSSAAGSAVVREARQGDREALLEIAEHDYTVSRFHLDPQIADSAARRIKRDWLDNYFNGERGDRLLVAELDGALAGFLLTVEAGDAAVIDLIAVASAARGRGTGRALVASLIDASRGRSILVGTQVANVRALRFYERLGFSVDRTQFVLHRHA